MHVKSNIGLFSIALSTWHCYSTSYITCIMYSQQFPLHYLRVNIFPRHILRVYCTVSNSKWAGQAREIGRWGKFPLNSTHLILLR
jgi:hypothetical protein